MVTSRDAPALSMIYKLAARQEVPGRWQAVANGSKDKVTLGERKQVWRQYDSDGRAQHDVIGLVDEQRTGEPLLQQYIAGGRLAAPLPSVTQIAARARQQVLSLPEAAKDFAADTPIRRGQRGTAGGTATDGLAGDGPTRKAKEEAVAQMRKGWAPCGTQPWNVFGMFSGPLTRPARGASGRPAPPLPAGRGSSASPGSAGSAHP